MVDLNLRYVNVVLLGAERHSRHLIKSALQGLGFEFVPECRSVDQVRSLVYTANPDLLLLDFDVDVEKVCQLISDIRHQRIGDNPFIVIIGMIGQADEQTIRMALSAGTDDIVRKPVSARILAERIANLVRNRKQFVATPDYVGPERAQGVIEVDDEMVPLEVPNSLRQKATNDRLSLIDTAAIRRAAENVNVQRLYSLAIEVGTRCETIKQRIADGENARALSDDIVRVGRLVERVAQVDAPEDNPHLARLATSMRGVMEAVIADKRPSARRFEVLRLHALAVAATLRGDVDATDTVATALAAAVNRDRQSA